MSDTRWREFGPSDLPRVLASALDVFAAQGYHGASIRDVAAGAGLSVPGTYHYYRSKQEILSALMVAVMNDLLGRCKDAVAESGSEPGEQFDRLVECLLRFHMFRREEAFVASSEIRSLEPDNRARYVALRDQQQRMLDDVVLAGVDRAQFATPYPLDASRAVVTMCVGVSSWFRIDGLLDPDELVERYTALARGLVVAV